jgi:hypothetical protein
MTKIYYKYRSLENYKSFVDIILKNRLYAAPYKDLNDPMEGQYYYRHGELNEKIRNKIRDEKGELRICSLSRVNNNELMWSHYTNGQRGVAIGVTIDESIYDVKPIRYKGITYIRNQDYNNETAIEILSNKLEVWNYEEEERVFIRNEHFVDVHIEKIITGRAMSHKDFSMLRDLVERVNSEITIIKADTILDELTYRNSVY